MAAFSASPDSPLYSVGRIRRNRQEAGRSSRVSSGDTGSPSSFPGSTINPPSAKPYVPTADRPARLLERDALHGRTVTSAALDLERHVELAGLGQVRDHELGIQDLDIVVALDVPGADRARALLRQSQLGLLARMHARGDLLQVAASGHAPRLGGVRGRASDAGNGVP